MSRIILTVDDSPTVLRSLKMVLEGAGYQVVQASDGTEALGLLYSGIQVDAVITDLNMPRMDGLTLIREIRTIPRYRFVPILMLITESQAARKEESRRAGASGWIVKPFREEQLLAALRRLGV